MVSLCWLQCHVVMVESRLLHAATSVVPKQGSVRQSSVPVIAARRLKGML